MIEYDCLHPIGTLSAADRLYRLDKPKVTDWHKRALSDALHIQVNIYANTCIANNIRPYEEVE